MEEKNNNQKEDEIEIDLKRLVGAVVNKAWLICLVAVISAILVFAGTVFFVTPQYESSTMFYVNNSSFSMGDISISGITSSDITASKNLVKSYIVILNTRETMNDVIDYAGVDLTYGQLKKMISAESVDNTEIFRIVVTSPDPVEAQKIAAAIAYILPNRIDSIIEGTSSKIVDSAIIPSSPCAPNYTKSALIGFAIGLALMIVLVVVLELMDVSIHTEEDVNDICHYPVLAMVPDMTAQGKGGYYYGYGKKTSDKAKSKESEPPKTVGPEISFAASEAYKLLRTKLQFSFVDENDSRVIGVSSALTGEGKSLTAVNLAYAFAQLGKKVLLIDCDMRRPSLADKLPIRKTSGLSEFLTGQAMEQRLIQVCMIDGTNQSFHVISSGRTPPNPMELISSARMKKMLKTLRQSYDYIILDLPPVGEVGDALAIAKYTDGILTVVRQNHCDRMSLASAVRQFEFLDTKMLGIVFNCTTDDSIAYGSKYLNRYYKRYGKYSKYGRYNGYYGHQSSYANADQEDKGEDA